MLFFFRLFEESFDTRSNLGSKFEIVGVGAYSYHSLVLLVGFR